MVDPDNTREDHINNKPVKMEQAREVKQAMKDDAQLEGVADHIQVDVKNGAIVLKRHVATEQEVNLATNTATAVGMVDYNKVDNSGLKADRKPVKSPSP